jgi:hypothetical protein
MLIAAGVDVNMCAERDNTTISSLEAALPTALDHDVVEGMFEGRMTGPNRTECRTRESNCARVQIKGWVNKRVPMLLNAGADVSQWVLHMKATHRHRVNKGNTAEVKTTSAPAD